MTRIDVLTNLEKLIGQELDYDEIICAFEDFEEDGETDIIVKESENAGYDYIAYINAVNSTQFLFRVNDNDIITDVEMYS